MTKPKLGTDKRKLYELLQLKIEIQGEEDLLSKDQAKLRKIVTAIRSRGQRVGKMKKTLFDMI